MAKTVGNGGEPTLPSTDMTAMLIELRNLIGRLPNKGTMIRLHTGEATYVGRIQAINIPERRVTLTCEDGVTVVLPFHALMMPPNGNGGH